MTLRIWLRAVELVAIATFAATLLVAWRADRRDRVQLAAELATAKQALAQADTRQHDRDAQLAQTLSALAAEKRRVTTSAEIIRELPKQIPLPAPIALQPAPSQTPGGSFGKNGHLLRESAPEPVSHDNTGSVDETASNVQAQTQVVIPTEDLKPLYDFTIDCKACQAKLAAAQGDLNDERTKTAVLAKERNAAIRLARGGSPLRRIARAAKWFLLGTAAGAIATQARH
jgi:hypothetical protein